MRADRIHSGDRIEVDLRGAIFTATVEEVIPGSYVRLKDHDPGWAKTYIMVSPRRVKKVLERAGEQQRLGVAA